MNERITFTVKTNNGTPRVTGTLVAENLAYHRPVGYPSVYERRPSAGDTWDLTQVSSGQRVGRFRTIDAATFFAEVAAKMSPNLVGGRPLGIEEARALGELRQNCGGRLN